MLITREIARQISKVGNMYTKIGKDGPCFEFISAFGFVKQKMHSIENQLMQGNKFCEFTISTEALGWTLEDTDDREIFIDAIVDLFKALGYQCFSKRPNTFKYVVRVSW